MSISYDYITINLISRFTLWHQNLSLLLFERSLVPVATTAFLRPAPAVRGVFLRVMAVPDRIRPDRRRNPIRACRSWEIVEHRFRVLDSRGAGKDAALVSRSIGGPVPKVSGRRPRGGCQDVQDRRHAALEPEHGTGRRPGPGMRLARRRRPGTAFGGERMQRTHGLLPTLHLKHVDRGCLCRFRTRNDATV